MATRTMFEKETAQGAGTRLAPGGQHTEQFRTEAVAAAYCTCGRAMFDAANVSGICNGCGSVLCADCAKTRCSICNAICCDQPSCSDTLAGRKVCMTHSHLAYLKFAFFGGR